MRRRGCGYGVRAGRSPREVRVLATVTPIYALGHGLGMWRGLAELLRRSPVILVVFGTTGELIKLAPVLLRLDERGHRYVLATTGQQVQQIPSFLDQFGLRQPDLWLARGRADATCASTRTFPAGSRTSRASSRVSGARCALALRDGPGRPLVLVHGDTMTTVLGSVMGRSLRAPVAHIEGGLRSYDLRHPFPEELNRKLATALSRIHYAPGAWAARTCAGRRRRHRLEHDPRQPRARPGGDPPFPLPDEPFGIVSLHRFELLNNRALLTETIERARGGAQRTPLLFIDHPVTIAALERFGLDRHFDETRFVRASRVCASSTSSVSSAAARSSSPTAAAARRSATTSTCRVSCTA